MKTLILYFIILLSILNHQEIIIENQEILIFFLYQLLPSLFILCFFIQLLPFPKINEFHISLLNINSTALFLIIKMLLLGIPTSAYLVNQLVKNKYLNNIQGKRLIYCINIPSISFMFMTISHLSNLRSACIIFIVHCISIFILLFLSRKDGLCIHFDIKNNTIPESISFTIKSMSFILAYLFIITSLKSLFVIYLPNLKMIFDLTFEFSSGVSSFIYSIKYCLLCIGFGGFCAHLQIMNGCDQIILDYKHFLVFRIIHCILNFLLIDIFLYIALFLNTVI